MADLVTPDELIPKPHEFVLEKGAPDSVAGWKALVDDLLTDQACVFHRSLVDASLCRIFDEARDYASHPCIAPRLR